MAFTGLFKAEDFIAADSFDIVSVHEKVDALKAAAFQFIHAKLKHDPAKAFILLTG